MEGTHATQEPGGQATQPSASASASVTASHILPAVVDHALQAVSASQPIPNTVNSSEFNQAFDAMLQRIRIIPLQEAIERNLRAMNREELRGAIYVLGPLSAYLLSKCTERQDPAFNKVALVKTMEDLFEIAVEIDVNNGYATDGEDSE